MMTKALVISLQDRETARVMVVRERACGGHSSREGGASCASCAGCGSGGTYVNVRASIEPGLTPRPGDTVLIESRDAAALWLAATVFILPAVGFMLPYFVFQGGKGDNAALLAGLGGLALSAGLVYLLNRLLTLRKQSSVRIVSVENAAAALIYGKDTQSEWNNT